MGRLLQWLDCWVLRCCGTRWYHLSLRRPNIWLSNELFYALFNCLYRLENHVYFLPSYFDMHACSCAPMTDNPQILLTLISNTWIVSSDEKAQTDAGSQETLREGVIGCNNPQQKELHEIGSTYDLSHSIRNAGSRYTNFSDNQRQPRFISKRLDLNRQTFIIALMR